MLEDMFDLGDQVAIVTGGGSGIGEACCRTFVQAGARVAVVDVIREAAERVAKALCEQGGEAQAFIADVSKKEQVEKTVEAIEKGMGPVDILVNSAGISIRKKALEFELADWQKVIDVNLTGTFLPCQAVGRRMVSRRRGRIVNLSSVCSTIAMIDRAAYCSSKGGVSLLTKVLALEWATYGVNVNAIGPGFIRTPLLADGPMKTPNFAEQVKSVVPMQRVGETQDLQGLLLLLCSEAGAYITGQTFYVDGGWTIW